VSAVAPAGPAVLNDGYHLAVLVAALLAAAGAALATQLPSGAARQQAS
jgi:hypothetical protein